MQSIISVSHLALLSSRPRPLWPDLIDGGSDAFVSDPVQLARSQVIAQLIAESDESAAQLSTDQVDGELASLGHLRTEVDVHLHRLRLIAEFHLCPARTRGVQLMPAVTRQQDEQGRSVLDPMARWWLLMAHDSLVGVTHVIRPCTGAGSAQRLEISGSCGTVREAP